ncbi:MAG TPA: hypothetical protein VFJ16_10870 [Longimicrobium sp.]|nr:hypothetical protein [Longimicrobium sp.]
MRIRYMAPAILLVSFAPAHLRARERLTLRDIAEIRAHPQCWGPALPGLPDLNPVPRTTVQERQIAQLITRLRGERDTRPPTENAVILVVGLGTGKIREVTDTYLHFEQGEDANRNNKSYCIPLSKVEWWGFTEDQGNRRRQLHLAQALSAM